MCRALKVLCVAGDAEALARLRRAAVGASWELAPGATTEADALAQLDREGPHVVVAFGEWERLVAAIRERAPGIRGVTDRDHPGADVVATSLGEVRDAIAGRPRPGGPVRL
jgi:hypothetical protein